MSKKPIRSDCYILCLKDFPERVRFLNQQALCAVDIFMTDDFRFGRVRDYGTREWSMAITDCRFEPPLPLRTHGRREVGFRDFSLSLGIRVARRSGLRSAFVSGRRSRVC